MAKLLLWIEGWQGLTNIADHPVASKNWDALLLSDRTGQMEDEIRVINEVIQNYVKVRQQHLPTLGADDIFQKYNIEYLLQNRLGEITAPTDQT